MTYIVSYILLDLHFSYSLPINSRSLNSRIIIPEENKSRKILRYF